MCLVRQRPCPFRLRMNLPALSPGHSADNDPVDPGTVDLSGINWIVVGTMTGVQSRKVHTEPEWAWSLTDQAHTLGIPVFMKEDLVPIIGDENMIQEMPEEFNKVLEVQRSWQK